MDCDTQLLPGGNYPGQKCLEGNYQLGIFCGECPGENVQRVIWGNFICSGEFARVNILQPYPGHSPTHSPTHSPSLEECVRSGWWEMSGQYWCFLSSFLTSSHTILIINHNIKNFLPFFILPVSFCAFE